MVLERDERLVRASGVSFTAIALVAATVVLAAAEVYAAPLWGLLIGLAAAAYAVFGTTEVLLTEERVIEYRPLLARLARRYPGLRSLERSWRRSIDLHDVTQSYSSGPDLVLRDGQRRLWRLGCHSKAAASELAQEIVEVLKRQFEAHKAEMLARRQARRRSEVMTVRVADAATSGPVRCVYCHDDVREDDELTRCPRCDTAHHSDCYEVHGRCAVPFCEGRARIGA